LKNCVYVVSLLWAFVYSIPAGMAATESAGEQEHARMTRKVPRLAAGIGRVEFPITCQQQLTQLYFNQAVAWLHGGDKRQADESFYHASWIEPECAMAWWGLAMANVENRTLAAYYTDKAVRLQERVSDRERRWIAALVDYLDEGTGEADRRMYFTKSLDRIATEYPDDLEAKAFLVRQFLDNCDVGIPVPYTAAVDALINEVLREQPEHPIHHYRILLWEQDQPQRTLASAEYVQRSMPEAPIVLTAAGRLYAQLSKNDEALLCFEASAGASQRQMRDQRLCPGEVEGYLENMEQLITHLAQVGRASEAIALARQLIELPTCAPPPIDSVVTAAPRHGAAKPRPRNEPANATTTGQRLLLELLVELKMWDEVLTLARSVYVESADSEIQVRKAHALGLAHFARQDADNLAAQLQTLRQLTRQLSSSHSSELAQRKLVYRAQLYLDELASCDEMARGGRSTESRAADGSSQESPPQDDRAPLNAAVAWEPLPAPAFVLPDRNGNVITLKSLRGKPVVLVFYLGAGCPHCIEQLQTFAPLREDFEKAGVTVIAVSTDSIEGLKDTFRIAGAGDAIPFLLASDQQLGTFREFGAIDRRENKPLHGTFLIDPRGRVVWQNISREPFMATRQLLLETQRVVALGEFAQNVPTLFTPDSE
jgi:peroxiredoxin/tetratricopeptide (TPR) repeat protein